MLHLIGTALLCFFAMYLSLESPAISDDGDSAFQSLVLAATTLQTKVAAPTSSDGLTAAHLVFDANALNSKFQSDKQHSVPVSPAYVKNIVYDADQLNKAAANVPIDRSLAIGMMQDVFTDLEVKLQHARREMGLDETLGISTTLQVNATRGGALQTQFTIWLNPLRWANIATPMYSINPPSSSLSIPPGQYRIFVLSGANKLEFSAAQGASAAKYADIPIGLDGKATQTLNITIK